MSIYVYTGWLRINGNILGITLENVNNKKNICLIWFCYRVIDNPIFNIFYLFSFIRDVWNYHLESKYKLVDVLALANDCLTHLFPYIFMLFGFAGILFNSFTKSFNIVNGGSIYNGFRLFNERIIAIPHSQ